MTRSLFRTAGLLLAVTGLAAAAGCSTPSTPAPGPTSAPPNAAARQAGPPATTAPATTPPAATPAPPGPASAGTPPAAASPTPVPPNAGAALTADQACTPEALLAFVRTQPGSPTGFKEVKVYNCAKNFARLYAVPNPGGNGDQFFLKFGGGTWSVLAHGTGIDCGDERPLLAEACASFG